MTMATTTLLDVTGTTTAATPAAIAAAVAQGPIWLDVVGSAADALEAFTAAGLDDETRQWLAAPPQPATFDLVGEVLRIVTFPLDGAGTPREVRVALAGATMVTLRPVAGFGLDELVASFAAPVDPRRPGLIAQAGLAVYEVLAAMATTSQAAVDALERSLEDLEELALGADRSIPGEVAGVRHRIVALRRSVAPFRSQVERYHRVSVAYHRHLDDDTRALLDSYATQLGATVDSLVALRDQANELLDIYDSAVSTRQSEVINWLTLVSMIFLPLTFFTGFFGMNFQWMIDRLDSAVTFWLFGIGIRAAMVVAVLMLFQRRGWFAVTRPDGRVPPVTGTPGGTTSVGAVEL
jgi:magnesium transporter